MLTSDFKEFAALLNSNKVEVQLDGIALGFIAIEDFKINKKAVGRHQDLADLETLERLKVLLINNPAGEYR